MPSIETWNWIGLAVFLFCTVGYHTAYHFWARSRPFDTVKGKVGRYRKDWVEQIIATRNIILAVQTIRNLIMATTWLAGSILLVIAFLITQGFKGADADVFAALGIVDQGFLTYKVDLLLLIFAYAFLMFLFTIRHLVLFNVLIGTSPELITQVEGIEASEYLGQLINKAHSRFTLGLRSTYFAVPAFSWLFNVYAFIVLTVVIWLWLLLVMDTRAFNPPVARPST